MPARKQKIPRIEITRFGPKLFGSCAIRFKDYNFWDTLSHKQKEHFLFATMLSLIFSFVLKKQMFSTSHFLIRPFSQGNDSC